MLALFTLASSLLVCPAPRLVGFGPALDLREYNVVTRAQSRCFELYKNSPCPVEIHKIGPRAYTVTCGAARELTEAPAPAPTSQTPHFSHTLLEPTQHCSSPHPVHK